MNETIPSVFLIVRPSVIWDELRSYLTEVDGTPWLERIEGQSLSAAEVLVEFAGRLCYRSWAPGLNPNVRRIREDSGEYIDNILRSRHGSVLEHAQYSFVFHNVSRVFTHELVRHRVGIAVSQESLRYVRLSSIGFRLPPALEPLRTEVVEIVEQLEEFQRQASKELGLEDDELPFSVKKEVTSAIRRLAPIGISTDVVWSANVRTIRHVIEMRTATAAEEEMRLVFAKVAELMQDECPLLFSDFVRDESGSWTPRYSKV